MPEPEPGLTTYSISARVLVYAMLVTLMLAVGLTVAMSWVAWDAMTDSMDLRDSLRATRTTSSTCRIALERMDAKMELVDAWVLNAKRVRSGSNEHP